MVPKGGKYNYSIIFKHMLFLYFYFVHCNLYSPYNETADLKNIDSWKKSYLGVTRAAVSHFIELE